jgi:hypothetical protein
MKDSFWDRLQSFESSETFNPWRDADPLDADMYGALYRRQRLEIHLERDAKYLLVGEAPGYRGCHFSGIPFTCEKQLCANQVPGIRMFQRITTRDLPWSEGSATIIWGTLKELGIADSTVLWNAFAFHPFAAISRYSNRTPTPNEVTGNADILAAVIARHRHAKIFAVGKIAQRTLASLGISAILLRHPSMGGANQFREQLRSNILEQACI